MPVESGKDFEGVTAQEIRCSIVTDSAMDVAESPFRFKDKGGIGVAKFDHLVVGIVFRAVHNSIVAKAVADLLGDAAWNDGFDVARVKHIHASHVYHYTPLLLL